MPLLWRVFAVNALVLTLAATVLVVSPATVSFPVAATEAAVLAAGLTAMLVINLVLLRRAFEPLERLKGFMRRVDPLRPGERVAVTPADPEVSALTDAFNEMIDRLETERRESARRMLAVQEEERVRIARELHDEVGQLLTGIMLELERVGRHASDGVRPAIEETRDRVREGLEDIRAIARRVRPEALDDLGLPAALAALTADVSRSAGIEVTRRIDPALPPLAPEEELVVYRVAQEGLTNVARHAGARSATLELAAGGGPVALRVADDGRGFDPAVAGGAGIRGMRERAVLVGGRLDIRSRRGEGSEVHLTLSAAERPA